MYCLQNCCAAYKNPRGVGGQKAREAREALKYPLLLKRVVFHTTQMNLSMKQEQTHRHREQTWGCPGVGGG